MPSPARSRKAALWKYPWVPRSVMLSMELAEELRKIRRLRLVQMGGRLSGRCVPAQLIDTVIDYKCLAATGAIMGSNGMVVMDETTCMVDMARFSWTSHVKSCGKCVACRIRD